MTKATLADAWRAENGQVQPERMLDAMETSLRNANHMEQGYTLIHHLVGIAEQALVQTNARKALQHNVFSSPDQLETALDTLRQYDHYDATAATWLPTEHAAAMDAVQQIFTPATPDGQPQLNREKARRFIAASLAGEQVPTEEAQARLNEKLDKLAAMSPEEVRKAADAIDSHFRELGEKWQIGYPQVRSGDIAQLEAKNHDANALAELVFPSLSRAYRQPARYEASRRATQLSYEVHLFKARNGRWPSSLNELPQETGDKSRIDPFTGGDFGYRLTESGPTIYTSGEDGQDNGGVHSDKWDDGKDYVFWPPQK
jgi:plasmid stabilization system protein ParE